MGAKRNTMTSLINMLLYHQRKVHNMHVNGKTYPKCKKCGQGFMTAKSCAVHTEKCIRTKYQCNICNTCLKNEKMLLNHLYFIYIFFLRK